jgi:hypothetical protein
MSVVHTCWPPPCVAAAPEMSPLAVTADPITAAAEAADGALVALRQIRHRP